MKRTDPQYQSFVTAYKNCAIFDEDFANTYFHVLMENPVERYICEDREKIKALSASQISQEFKDSLLTFLDTLENLGPDEYSRYDGIDLFFDDPIEDFAWHKRSAEHWATHDKNGFSLTDDGIFAKAVKAGAEFISYLEYYLNNDSESANATKRILSPELFTQLYTKLDPRKHKTISTKGIHELLSAIDSKLLRDGGKVDPDSLCSQEVADEYIKARFAGHAYRACFSLLKLPSMVRSEAFEAISFELMDREAKARAAEITKANELKARKDMLPAFFVDMMEERLLSLTLDHVQSFSDALERYQLRSAQDILDLYEVVQDLQFWVTPERLNASIQKERKALDEKIESASSKKGNKVVPFPKLNDKDI